MITQEELRKELTYDPETGVFEWFVFHGRTGGSLRADYSNGKSYRIVRCKGRSMPAAHAAWIYTRGEIPKGLVIDHIDGNPANNRLDNLRAITQKENGQNRSRRGYGEYGVTGVAPLKSGKWRVHGVVDGRVKWVGTFATLEAATAFSHQWRFDNYSGYVGRD